MQHELAIFHNKKRKDNSSGLFLYRYEPIECTGDIYGIWILLSVLVEPWHERERSESDCWPMLR